MLPMTGPFTTTVVQNTVGAGNLRMTRKVYKQKRPYNLPLPYAYNLSRCLSASDSLPSGPQPISAGHQAGLNANSTWNDTKPYELSRGYTSTFDSLVVQPCLGQCRGKYRDKIMGGVEAALGVSLGERKQAMDMMTARLSQLYRFTRAVTKFQWTKAAEELKLDADSRKKFKKLTSGDKLRASSKHFANNWLEFHFGWSPLLGDIHDAMEVLVSPVQPTKIKVSKRRKYSYYSDNRVLRYDSYLNKHTGYFRWSMGSQFEVSNPNLYLLNRLGIINPLSVAWELAPWSFVLDWFVNVSDFLEQFGEFAGVSRTNAWFSATLEDRVDVVETHGAGATKSTWLHTCHAISTERKLGDPPSIVLNVKPRWNLSPSRGLTAASLLLQVGLGHPKSAYPESRVRTTTWPLHTDYFTQRK